MINSAFFDVACGLHYIHNKDIIHCDLTADSICLTENFTAKIADFGRATYCQQKIKYLPETLDHLPPEIIERCSMISCSAKVDVFSFGCVIIHTFTKELPVPDLDKYNETSGDQLFKRVSEVDRRLICLKRLKIAVNNAKLHAIVLSCLEDDPRFRPTAEDLTFLLKNQSEIILGM